MLRAHICSIICIAKNIKQKSVTKFKKWLSWLAQRVVITVKARDVLGSSRQAHQYLLFFKENIKGQKSKFWLVGRQKPTRPYFIYKSLNKLKWTVRFIQKIDI